VRSCGVEKRFEMRSFVDVERPNHEVGVAMKTRFRAVDESLIQVED
jgi:hypothetical protein